MPTEDAFNVFDSPNVTPHRALRTCGWCQLVESQCTCEADSTDPADIDRFRTRYTSDPPRVRDDPADDYENETTGEDNEDEEPLDDEDEEPIDESDYDF